MDKGIYIFQLFLSSCSTDRSISQVTGCNLWYTTLYVGNAIVLIDNTNADELAPCLMGCPSNFLGLAISLVPMTCWPVDLLRKLTLIVGCVICAVDIAKAVSESSGIIDRDGVLVGHVAALTLTLTLTLTQVRLWIQNLFLVCGDSFVLCQWFSGKIAWCDCIWVCLVFLNDTSD